MSFIYIMDSKEGRNRKVFINTNTDGDTSFESVLVFYEFILFRVRY